jgi:hypothetical protein
MLRAGDTDFQSSIAAAGYGPISVTVCALAGTCPSAWQFDCLPGVSAEGQCCRASEADDMAEGQPAAHSCQEACLTPALLKASMSCCCNTPRHCNSWQT